MGAQSSALLDSSWNLDIGAQSATHDHGEKNEHDSRKQIEQRGEKRYSVSFRDLKDTNSSKILKARSRHLNLDSGDVENNKQQGRAVSLLDLIMKESPEFLKENENGGKQMQQILFSYIIA